MGKTRETKTEIDPYLTQLERENLQRGVEASKIPFLPNRGIRIAAMTPREQAAMGMTNNALGSLGLAPMEAMAALDPLAGMPQAEEVGGIRGYSTGALYDDALAKSVPTPIQDYISNFFVNPGGAPPGVTDTTTTTTTTPVNPYEMPDEIYYRGGR